MVTATFRRKKERRDRRGGERHWKELDPKEKLFKKIRMAIQKKRKTKKRKH